ncbi:hypothetical protein [Halalkalibacter alkalisediminis]|uniref:Uncharacterized protein n=1 Tax=Halalkalibacter alkalisediminis TaxID=935616 RepID=A0ABV6NJ83_9BACI
MSTRTETSATALSNEVGSTPEMQQQMMIQAMLEGINFSFYISSFIAVLALILAFFIKRAKQEEDPIEKESSEENMYLN